MPNPLLTSDVQAFMSVGEVDLGTVRTLWPTFSCSEADVYLNPRLIWRHMETRSDFALRLKMFNALGQFVPDIVAAPHVTARYSAVPRDEAGVNLVCPLRGFDGWGDHLVVCVRLVSAQRIRAGNRHHVATLFPWHERKRTTYLAKNEHLVHERHCIITPNGPVASS